MPVEARFITDPACSRSWGAEPALRRLMLEFGEDLEWTWVMGGLARDFTKGYAGGDGGLVTAWLDTADATGMPIDPRLWTEGPVGSSYPACMAVKAATEQGPEAAYRYLRSVREGLMCFRRKLDTTEALVEEARRAGLDVERFRRDLGSHAIVEAFGADLEEARTVPDEARAQGAVEQFERGERVSFPTAVFVGADGARHGVYGPSSYEDYRAAASAAGAVAASGDRPGVLEALGRFGRMATRELEEVCGLAGPPAAAELWRLATEWRVRPLRVLTGWLWELA